MKATLNDHSFCPCLLWLEHVEFQTLTMKSTYRVPTRMKRIENFTSSSLHLLR
jgi:hypothetical protein